jgi:hypothetical protein
MRYKVAPEPAEEDLLFGAHEALPLVPGSVEDCCTRVRDRTAVPSREDAREWITFLQALGLVVETDRGFYRVRETPERGVLRENFLKQVFGAREISDTLHTAGEPLAPRDVFEGIREIVPRWERDREPAWETEWAGRVATLLAWGVVLGVFEERDGAYTASDSTASG